MAKKKKVSSPGWLEEAGLTCNGEKIAKMALPKMMEAVTIAGPFVAELVLKEAIFRLYVLPTRTKEYQLDYKKVNNITI